MTNQWEQGVNRRPKLTLYRRPKLTPFSVLQNEPRLEWYGTRHERSKPRASAPSGGAVASERLAQT
jgi:hypothetical protein